VTASTQSPHIVLLGDSIFDNKSYTSGEPDVVHHLRDLLPQGWRASLLAVDGAITADLDSQLRKTPADVSHVIISVGGNDALMNGDLLNTRVQSTAETLRLFGERVSEFERGYRSAVDRAVALKRATTVCTIYNGNLERDQARLAWIALMPFNDVILRTAFEWRLAVIDLRLVCASPSDYANPIEPSGSGGRKIAEAIARACGALDAPPPSRVYAV
jgi:GDSL-like Lipase/Acylhydrolase family